MTKNASPAAAPADHDRSPASGLLLLDKPAGITSHTAVQKVRRALRARRAGHAGTLDPMATGLLLVAVGQATRLLEYQLAADKGYRAQIRLGVRTDSLDREGTVLERAPLPPLDAEQVRHALQHMVGPQEQVAPAFSAIKVDGERLYQRARRGETVSTPARPIVIHRLDLLHWQAPDLIVDVHCSKGTYIRSLARDLGERLGTPGCLWQLQRTHSGPFTLCQALPLAAVQQDPAAAQLQMLTLAEMVTDLPQLIVGDEDQGLLITGRPIPRPAGLSCGEAAALSPNGQLVAVVRVADDQVRPRKVFASHPL